ncbi:Pre-mRNA-splicing factor Cwf15/Cwc15 [Trinorchestia longiramus]|nr:Pre-mRNA-splicing factor Cwf15/Cwc15 [Trinorchestia longiramus]
MTTAARPTFEPAKGGSGRGERDLSALSKQYSSRDLPSHTRLKYRETGQTTADELRGRDLRRELEDRERVVQADKRGTARSRGDATSSVSSTSKKPRLDQIASANLDADDPQDSNSDDDSDSDDEAALMAELEHIRKERAEEESKQQQIRHQNQERIRMENIISGNPLLHFNPTKSDMKVKRRWDDDVVFKNCAASEPDSSQKSFINDSLRSEFHKRFMEKYVK